MSNLRDFVVVLRLMLCHLNKKVEMPYSPAEALRTNSWRLRMAYSPEDIERHHPAWHEEMQKKEKRVEEKPPEHLSVFPHAVLDSMAAD